MIEYCRSFLEVYFTPASSRAGRFQNASTIPKRMPRIGPPTTGTARPINQAGIATSAARPMPGNLLMTLSIVPFPLRKALLLHGNANDDGAQKVPIRTVHATRYVMPLREGGSLPAIIEADDDGMYVLKFRGAGQGAKALVAELVAGEIGRALGLPVPEIVFVDLDTELARTEPDPEVQELIRASGGLNLALDYLPGSITFDPAVETVDSRLASDIVWFDAFVTNIDRTPRNTNMLMWHRKLWLIDHGAALYFHHAWGDYVARSQDRFPLVRDHVLLPFATEIADSDARLSALITPALISEVISQIPDAWLVENTPFSSVEEHRDAYVEYLVGRIEGPRAFVEEAIRAHTLSL